MPQRQRAARFHLAERKADMQVCHIRQVDLHVPGKLAEGVEVAADHLQLKRASAVDAVAAHHTGNRADGCLQRLHNVVAVARRVESHEGEHAHADLVAVDAPIRRAWLQGASSGDLAGHFDLRLLNGRVLQQEA